MVWVEGFLCWGLRLRKVIAVVRKDYDIMGVEVGGLGEWEK